MYALAVVHTIIYEQTETKIETLNNRVPCGESQRQLYGIMKTIYLNISVPH